MCIQPISSLQKVTKQEDNEQEHTPHFSDSRFSDGSSGVFTPTMSKFQWFVQPPQSSSAIPPTINKIKRFSSYH